MDCVTTACSSLLLASVPSELADISGCLPPVAGWQARCFGVGVIAASVATTRLLMELKPSKVLVVGTCGSYDKKLLSVGDFLRVSHAISTSLDVLEGRAYRPRSEQHSWPATLHLPVTFPALSVAVTPGVTKTYYGARLLSSIAAVEHLELTGIFAACHDASVPCGAILAVANHVGPEAHAQWLVNHTSVSRNLVGALKTNGIFGALLDTLS